PAHVELRGGDPSVSGGPARSAYHRVPRARPGTVPPQPGPAGRLDVTCCG
ncbi:alpha-ketoglutarate-dependent dioxygenase AlkB, partial [Streptomyces sp. TRM76130]|nr:alpha-ketoglutarate-dependent dioxygenase AlkB [Streptomyces sp. TRM76130]